MSEKKILEKEEKQSEKDSSSSEISFEEEVIKDES